MTRTSYKSQLMLGLSALVFLLAPVVSWATPTFAPPGLSAGDIFHYVFVSSTTRDATSSDITVYDGFVQGLADAALIGSGTGKEDPTFGPILWKAIGSTSSVSAKTNSGVSGPVYLLDDTLIAINEADLFDGTIVASISLTEDGSTTVPPITFVWTGTFGDGSAFSGFELGGSSNTSAVGLTSLTTGGAWLLGTTDPQLTNLKLYGISAPLAAVPEPATITLFGTGLLGLMGWAAWRKGRT